MGKEKKPQEESAPQGTCIKCGQPVRPDARQCPNCGLPQCDD